MRSAHLAYHGATLRELYDRYRLVKGSQPTTTIAAAIAITAHTLARYERNGIAGIMTLARIASWVEDEEAHLRHHAYQRLHGQHGGYPCR